MRGKDIEVGLDYAVVRTRSQGCEQQAVRGEVVAATPIGTWLVRFDEPMDVSHWNFVPASKKEHVYRDPNYPHAVSEFELESRQIVARWQDNLDFLVRQERQAAAQKSRQGQEEEMVTASLTELRRALAARGLKLEDNATAVSYRYVDKLTFRVGQLFLSGDDAEALCAIVAGRRRRKTAPASLSVLVEEMKRLIGELGFAADDERMQVSANYVWRNGANATWFQALLPPEVVGALAKAVSGDEAEPSALSDLLAPLVG